MIKFKDVTHVTQEPVEFTCDICGKSYGCLLADEGVMEAQEFINIRFEGGYGSVFGDESKVECDLCQHCLKEHLGKYLRVDG